MGVAGTSLGAAADPSGWPSCRGFPHAPPASHRSGDTHMALLAVVADKAVVDTTPHLAHLRVNPVCGSLICLQGGGGHRRDAQTRMTNSQTTGNRTPRPDSSHSHRRHISRAAAQEAARKWASPPTPIFFFFFLMIFILDWFCQRSEKPRRSRERSDLFMFTPHFLFQGGEWAGEEGRKVGDDLTFPYVSGTIKALFFYFLFFF